MAGGGAIDGEFLELQVLREAFPQLSLESIAGAYNDAGGCADAAADALHKQIEAAPCNRNNGVFKGAKMRERKAAATGGQNWASQHGKYEALLKGISCNGHAIDEEEDYDEERSNDLPSSISLNKPPAALSQVNDRNQTKKWITVRSGSVSNARGLGNAAAATDKKRKKKHHRKKQQKSEQQLAALEEFLLTMLGGESELGTDVVRDVIHECGGDPQKSLDSLLLMISDDIDMKNKASESVEGSDLAVLMEAFPDKNRMDIAKLYKEYGGDVEAVTLKLLEPEQNHTTKGKESSYQALFNQVMDQEYSSIQRLISRLSCTFPDVDKGVLAEILKASQFDIRAATNYLIEAGLKPAGDGGTEDVARDLLNSMFKPSETTNPPKTTVVKQPKEADETQEWKVVRAKPKPEKRHQNDTNDEKAEPSSYGDWDEYDRHHKSAAQHWSTMKHYFSEAAVAYANGERTRAGVLSEKGKEFKELAREARERASARIFNIKNKKYENNITIDLHSQHVDEALKLLKLHLKAFEHITTVHKLTLITGHGNHAQNGRPKLKPAIIAFLNFKGLKWSEVNPGRLQIDLHSS